MEVTDGVFRNVLSDDYRPPALPVVAAKLVRLANDERTTLDRVCAVVEEDPILATRILRIAQSAIYTRRGELHSIQQAVVRLGTEQVRDIVLEDVLNMHIFRCRDYQPIMERLRLHSVATAHVARRLAAEVDMPGQDVFLCGLLHDIGIAIALLALSEQPAPGRPSNGSPTRSIASTRSSAPRSRRGGSSPATCTPSSPHTTNSAPAASRTACPRRSASAKRS